MVSTHDASLSPLGPTFLASLDRPRVRLVMYFTIPSKPNRFFIAMTSFTPVDPKSLKILYDLKV